MAAEVGTPMNRRGVAGPGFQDPESLQDMSKTNKTPKLTQIGNWQRALREFMSSDARLSDLVSLYGQKFVQLGENKNFTLSTLTDMVWTVLVLTWEAILDKKLPLVGEAEAGYYKRYQDLQARFNQCRTDWLKEVSNLRDQKRQKQWSDGMQTALDTSMEHDIFTFMPENALDEDTREYFKLSMQENMKMALVKGAAAAGEQTQFLAQRLQQAEEKLADVTMLLDQKEGEILKLQGQLVDAQEDRRASSQKEVPNVESADPKLVSEVNQLKQDKKAIENKVKRLYEKLRALGFDGDVEDEINVEAIKKRWLVDHSPPQQVTRGGTMDVAEALHKNKKSEEEIEQLRQELFASEDLGRTLEFERDEAREQLKEARSRIVQLEKEIGISKKKIEEAEKAVKPVAAKGKADIAAEAVAKRKEAEAETEKKDDEKKIKKTTKGGETKVPTRSIGVGDHSVLEEEKVVGEKEIVYVERPSVVKDVAAKDVDDGAAMEAAIAAEVEKRLAKEVKKWEKMEAERKDREEKRDREKRMKEEEEAANLSEEERQRRKEEVAARRGHEAKMKEADEAFADAEAYGRSLEKKIRKLESQLEQTQESEERLKQKVAKMSGDIHEAHDVRKKLEMSLAELNKKFQDLKYQLMDGGIDTAVIEEAMEGCGLEKIINGPVINVFDRLYHDAMKRSTRRSTIEPRKTSSWTDKRISLMKSASSMLGGREHSATERSDSCESESLSADSGVPEAYSIFGRGRRRKSISEIPHLDGGKVLVRVLGSAETFRVKTSVVHLWTRPDLSASKMYKASEGTEVVGVPYEVGGMRWLLVYSARPKDWNPESEADEVLHGTYWSLIDGGPLEISHDILVPKRVSSAPRTRVDVDVREQSSPHTVQSRQSSPYSLVDRRQSSPHSLADGSPPQPRSGSGLDRFRSKVKGKGHAVPTSMALLPDPGARRMSIVNLTFDVDEHGNAVHSSGPRSRSGSPPKTPSGNTSRASSASKNSRPGSRPHSRPGSSDRYVTGRSPSPIAQRAEEATRMLRQQQGDEARGILTGAGVADSGSQILSDFEPRPSQTDARARFSLRAGRDSGVQSSSTDGGARFVSQARPDAEPGQRSSVSHQSVGEDELPSPSNLGYVTQNWPYRSPRRSLIAGVYSNFEDSQLATLDEQGENHAPRASLAHRGSVTAPSANSEDIVQRREASGEASPPRNPRLGLRGFVERGIDRVVASGGSKSTQALLSGQGGEGSSPSRESIVGPGADVVGHRLSQSSMSPNRGSLFNFTELEEQASPKLLARIPSEAFAGTPKHDQAKRKSNWNFIAETSPSDQSARARTSVDRSPSQQGPRCLNSEFGQNDQNVSSHSRHGQLDAKPRDAGVATERSTGGRSQQAATSPSCHGEQEHCRASGSREQSSAGIANERASVTRNSANELSGGGHSHRTAGTANERSSVSGSARAKPRTSGFGGEHAKGTAIEPQESGLGGGQADRRALAGASPGRIRDSQGVDHRVAQVDGEPPSRVVQEFPKRGSRFSITKSGSSTIAGDFPGGSALPALPGASQSRQLQSDHRQSDRYADQHASMRHERGPEAAGTRKLCKADRVLAMESPEGANDGAPSQTAEGADRRAPSTGSITGGRGSRPPLARTSYLQSQGQGPASEFSQTAPAALSSASSSRSTSTQWQGSAAGRPGSRGNDSGRPISRGTHPSRPGSRCSEVFDIVTRQPSLTSTQGSSIWKRPGERSSLTDATAAPQFEGAADLPLQRRPSDSRYLGGRSSDVGLISSASAPALLAADSVGNMQGRASVGVSDRSHAHDSEAPASPTYIHSLSTGVPAAGVVSCNITTTGDPWAMVEMEQKADVKFLPKLQADAPSPGRGSVRHMGGPKMTGKIFSGTHRVQQMRASVDEGQAPTAAFSRGRDASTRKLFLMKGAPVYDGTSPG